MVTKGEVSATALHLAVRIVTELTDCDEQEALTLVQKSLNANFEILGRERARQELMEAGVIPALTDKQEKHYHEGALEEVCALYSDWHQRVFGLKPEEC